MRVTRPRFCVFYLVMANALFAQANPSGSDGKLDEMVAAGKGEKELAQYVFNNHGCRSCHTLGHQGKLGFTEKGRLRRPGFEGCIRMLAAMTVIVQTPPEKRSKEQQNKAVSFEEFGCTSCHQVSPGKLGLTTAGAKLARLHLGCVDIEKVLARR